MNYVCIMYPYNRSFGNLYQSPAPWGELPPKLGATWLLPAARPTPRARARAKHVRCWCPAELSAVTSSAVEIRRILRSISPSTGGFADYVLSSKGEKHTHTWRSLDPRAITFSEEKTIYTIYMCVC